MYFATFEMSSNRVHRHYRAHLSGTPPQISGHTLLQIPHKTRIKKKPSTHSPELGAIGRVYGAPKTPLSSATAKPPVNAPHTPRAASRCAHLDNTSAHGSFATHAQYENATDTPHPNGSPQASKPLAEEVGCRALSDNRDNHWRTWIPFGQFPPLVTATLNSKTASTNKKHMHKPKSRLSGLQSLEARDLMGHAEQCVER